MKYFFREFYKHWIRVSPSKDKCCVVFLNYIGLPDDLFYRNIEVFMILLKQAKSDPRKLCKQREWRF